MNTARRLVTILGMSVEVAAGIAAAAPPAAAPGQVGVAHPGLKWMPAPALPKGVRVANRQAAVFSMPGQ